AAESPADLERYSSGQAVKEAGSIKVAGASYVDDLGYVLGGDLDHFATRYDHRSFLGASGKSHFAVLKLAVPRLLEADHLVARRHIFILGEIDVSAVSHQL